VANKKAGAEMQAIDEGTALLRRILECPEDDAPRLIYSDWLEECGEEERAKEIRYFVANPLFVIASPLGTNGIMVELRGFISEIRLTTEQFCGGSCQRCDGSGIHTTSNLRNQFYANECHKCKGTGRIEGVARELFMAHPITKVVLVDRKPELVHISGGYRAPSWTNNHQLWPLAITSILPFELYKIVAQNGNCHTTMGVDDGWAACFETDQEANEALSAACVARGRKLAGLPALTA